MKKHNCSINEVALNDVFQRLTGLDPEAVDQLEVNPPEFRIGKLLVSRTSGIEISNISMSWRVLVVILIFAFASSGNDVNNLLEMFVPANSQANCCSVIKV